MQTDAAEQQEQIAALRDFAATGLAELERLLAGEKQAQITALENFAEGNVELAELKKLMVVAKRYTVSLDLFEGLNQWWRESFHSDFLAWLLNPQSNHGLGDYFLKNFLLQTTEQAKNSGIATATPADIDAMDWSETAIYRERNNIDILILNGKALFVCAIENKIFAREGIGADGTSQLTSYRKAMKKDYCNFERHYVFLDAQDRLPYHQEERAFWTPVNYFIVLELVEQAIEDNANRIATDVFVFLRQYATTLRRKIVPESSEVSKLARKIYLEHREAIDLIKDHEPAWQSETVQILKEAVARQNNWILDLTDHNYVRFRSANWDRFEAMQIGTGWAPDSNALLLFQFRFDDDELPYLDLGLSTGDETNNRLRTKLFETIRQYPGVFALKTTSLNDRNDRWPILHEEPECFLEDADYGVGWDDGTTRAKIEAWVSNFAEHQFPTMNEVIVKCLEEYEAEQA